MYWQIDYRGETGWKIKYYFGTREDVDNRIKRLKYDKIEIKNLSSKEVDILSKINKNFKLQIL